MLALEVDFMKYWAPRTPYEVILLPSGTHNELRTSCFVPGTEYFELVLFGPHRSSLLTVPLN
jgi:hypothetical protein